MANLLSSRVLAALRFPALSCRRVTFLLHQGHDLRPAALSTLHHTYRQRPSLLQQTVVPAPTVLATRCPADRNTAAFLRKDRRFCHTDVQEGRDDDVIWLFPGGEQVERMEAANKKGLLGMMGILTIISAQPLSFSDFEEVLQYLTKNMQTLRTCLRYRDGILWVCELKEPKLDFKEVADDIDTEKEAIIDFRHNSAEGPLWRARLQTCGPTDPHPIPELKDAFPHQYNLLPAFQHATADGVASMSVALHAISLLELGTKALPTSEEGFGNIVSSYKSEQIERAVKAEMEEDPQKLNNLLKDLREKKFKAILTEAFGTPEVSQPRSRTVSTVYDKSTVNKFNEKCAAAGVTFNCGFVSVINTAVVELVREAGLVRDSYTVSSRHAVDERRYWGGSALKDFGCHTGRFTSSMTLPHNNKQNFWEYAKLFDQDFRRKVKDKYPFQEKILRSMIVPKDISYDSYYAGTPPLECDFYFSNVRILNLPQWGKGERVRLANMRLFQGVLNLEYNLMLLLSGIQDNVLLDIIFSTGFITPETAQALSEKICVVFDDVANQ